MSGVKAHLGDLVGELLEEEVREASDAGVCILQAHRHLRDVPLHLHARHNRAAEERCKGNGLKRGSSTVLVSSPSAMQTVFVQVSHAQAEAAHRLMWKSPGRCVEMEDDQEAQTDLHHVVEDEVGEHHQRVLADSCVASHSHQFQLGHCETLQQPEVGTHTLRCIPHGP